jgi:uncharacterized protein YndB with AHSA1/START domain
MRAILSQTVFRRLGARRSTPAVTKHLKRWWRAGESWDTPLAEVDAREGGS